MIAIGIPKSFITSSISSTRASDPSAPASTVSVNGVDVGVSVVIFGVVVGAGSGVAVAVAVVVAVVVVLFCWAVTVPPEPKTEMLAMIRTVSSSLAVRAELSRFSVTVGRLFSEIIYMPPQKHN